MAVTEGTRIVQTGALEVTSCTCGIYFAVPERLIEKCRGDSSEGLYCPAGHRLAWSETTEDRLRKRLERAENQRAAARARADQAEASARAQKGAATRARNERNRVQARSKAGVCQCCGRTFKQLARHMESQHPDFTPGGE